MDALYDVPAPAKLNLFLHVVGRRSDGYHLLQSLFALVDWSDTLHFERRTDGRLVRHDRGDTLPAEDLCLRAARALQAACGTTTHGVDISIEKRLPSGAGLGGGSSDAATTLLALNRLWGLHLPRARLLEIALGLGADVPFFVGGRNAWVEGIGERLTPVTLPAQEYVVLKPPVGISTAALFSSLSLPLASGAAILAGFPADPSRWAAQAGRNDLQAPAECQCPEVKQALALLHARYGNSRMTGSGSAVFARIEGLEGTVARPLATEPADLPPGWIERQCRGLEQHPLAGWAEDR